MALSLRNRRVTVYNSTIRSLFSAAGEATEEAKLITRLVLADAVTRSSRFSPSPQKRLGKDDDRIISNHRRRVVPSGSRYGTRGYVENDSNHAAYKHDGTLGNIIQSRKRNGLMTIPPGRWGPRRVKSVSGQRGEPWLLDAANDVLLRYGVRLPPQ